MVRSSPLSAAQDGILISELAPVVCVNYSNANKSIHMSNSEIASNQLFVHVFEARD